MKNAYRSVLYALLGLLVVGGLSLFIFRVSLLSFFRARTETAIVFSTELPTVNNALDTAILASPRFSALKNNLINFNFDQICQASAASPTIINLTTKKTTVNAAACRLGNNWPFAAAP